ncbi:hypothetical protein I8752_00890 [Nostocaceae cyanobacterium CENA369]|uniref:Uncharacterized protein n=1 Tax=Dendronalium phyllosphericum CENA369 TaxID=1725256 RepID=A0A8J7HWU7_9NOST|nr:hypothetical protein [Dendronalium phyllosphericum]MBH8571604.1 hypothetical protein [Dendronalium phyllosphericum CENA369]
MLKRRMRSLSKIICSKERSHPSFENCDRPTTWFGQKSDRASTMALRSLGTSNHLSHSFLKLVLFREL